MNSYISLLRGINVSGQKKVPMVELRALYESLGLEAVQSYIQSGNVICATPDEDVATLTQTIERAIEQHFGFKVRVLIKTPQQLMQVLNGRPFDEERLFVTFLFGTPTHIPTEALDRAKQPSEQIHIAGDIVYFSCPDGYGRSKLSNSFLESQLKLSATTRNWRTVRKLLELAE